MNDLMQRRFKVIAEDTTGNFKVGETFIKSSLGDWYESETFEMPEWELKKFPHLFKELQWWEERSLDEMPEYIIDNTSKPKRVIKVDEWHINTEEDNKEIWASFNKKS